MGGNNTADNSLPDGVNYTDSSVYAAFDTSTTSCTACGLISNELQCCSDGTTGGACCSGTAIDTSTQGCCSNNGDEDGEVFSYATSLCCLGVNEVYANYGYQCCSDKVCKIPDGEYSCCS